MQHTVPLMSLTDPVLELSAQPRTDGACLVKIYPAVVSGSLIPLQRDQHVFGRDADCHYELADEFCSRRHSMFHREQQEWFVSDLGSTNGTFVNHVRVERKQLVNGDQIRIGTQIFKFLATDQIEMAYHETVFNMMTVDALTQTYNRRYFEDALKREVAWSVRHERPLGLLMLDIDHFKQLNDTYGHLVGDELLAGLCARISSQLRCEDVFARIGGEEFAITVMETSPEELCLLADRLCKLVHCEPFSTSRGPIGISISIGVSLADWLPEVCPKELCQVADANLYRAKQQGRNRYCG